METTLRATIDAMAREAAINSWDAHGEFWSAEDLYDFMSNYWLESEDPRADLVPDRMPAEFAHDYRRYAKCIQEGNPFIMSEVSRPWGTQTITVDFSDNAGEIVRCVERMKRDILALMDCYRIPADVRDFATLHDHVDANLLGGAEDILILAEGELAKAGQPEGDDRDTAALEMAGKIIDPATEIVNAWLKGGRE